MPKLNLEALATDKPTDALAKQSRLNQGLDHSEIVSKSMEQLRADNSLVNNVALAVAFESTKTTTPSDKIYSWEEIEELLTD